MITTTKGLLDERLLVKREGAEEWPDASVSWVEYWDGDELVHRSVHAALKGRDIGAVQGSFT